MDWIAFAKFVVFVLNWLFTKAAFREGWNKALAELDATTRERLARALAARAAPDVVRDDDPYRRD